MGVDQQTATARLNRAKWMQAHPDQLAQFKSAEGICQRCKGPMPKVANKLYCTPCRRLVKSDNGRTSKLRAKFGLTEERYQAMLTAQDGRCAICRLRPGPERRLAVDHNHKTGAIRGLLCGRCNHQLLGSAHEDPEILERAAAYLRSF